MASCMPALHQQYHYLPHEKQRLQTLFTPPAGCSAGSATSHTPHHSGGFSPPPPLPARRSEPDKSICHWPRPTHATLLLSYSPSSTAHAPRPPALTVSVKLTPEAGASCPPRACSSWLLIYLSCSDPRSNKWVRLCARFHLTDGFYSVWCACHSCQWQRNFFRTKKKNIFYRARSLFSPTLASLLLYMSLDFFSSLLRVLVPRGLPLSVSATVSTSCCSRSPQVPKGWQRPFRFF